MGTVLRDSLLCRITCEVLDILVVGVEEKEAEVVEEEVVGAEGTLGGLEVEVEVDHLGKPGVVIEGVVGGGGGVKIWD